MIPSREPSAFTDIDGGEKPVGATLIEDAADYELRQRSHTLPSLERIAGLSHPYAKYARLSLDAARSGDWPKAKRLWGNRVCAV